MTQVPRRTFLLHGAAVLCAATAPTAAPRRYAHGAPRDDAPFQDSLGREMPALMARHHVPGVSIATVREGRFAWERAFGVADASAGTPVDERTIFAAQSMSKPVFAYAVMKLHERRILDIDTPLMQYMPRPGVDGDERSRRLTARHVLSHTTGLQNWRSGATPLAFHFTPGERWQYSGEGYAYLQAVVTHLTGRTDANACNRYEGGVEVCATDIDAFMKAHVLQPFGMRSSGYVWTSAFARRLARAHDAMGRALPAAHPTATDAARYASSGGLLATASDYARFLAEVVDPKPADRVRLTAATLAEMLRPVASVPGDSLGSQWSLGWQVFTTAGGTVIAHGGDGRGEHSFAFASPARRAGFVIMTNGDGGRHIIAKLIADGVDRLFGE